MSTGIFKIDGSCNVITLGKNLDIKINVSKGENETFFLKSGTYISLKNIKFEGVSPKVTLSKNNNPSAELKEKEGEYKCKINYIQPYKSFQISITTDVPMPATFEEEPLNLQLSFIEKDSDEKKIIDFKVVVQSTSIEIIHFEANQTIIQKNKHQLSFDYEISGEPDDIKLTCDGVWDKDFKPNTNYDLSKLSVNANHYFTLQIKKGDQQVSKTVCIVYVDASVLKSRDLSPYNLENGNVPLIPINICASHDAKRLYALFSYEENKESKLVLGYTDHVDGHNWEFIEHTDNKDELRYFTNSPMVHLKSKDEVLGRLLFIGGSKIELNNKGDHKKNAAKVGIINLENDQFSLEEMKFNAKKMGAVWGHTCVVGKDTIANQEHTIFRIGGANNYGQCYDHIYSSTDGIAWKEWDSKQVTQTKDILLKRVAPSAAFTLGADSHFWVAGGFGSFGDTSIIEGEFKEAKDTNNTFIGYEWSKAIERIDSERILVQNEHTETSKYLNALKHFAIAPYTCPDGSGETGMLIIGFDESGMKVAKKISFYSGYLQLTDVEHFDKSDIKMSQTTALNTAFVNGCLFFTVISDAGQTGTKYSNHIYYYIPVLNTSTINFFK